MKLKITCNFFLHQNTPKWPIICIEEPQFRFISGGTLRIIIFLLKFALKGLWTMCKVLGNMLTGFWFMEFTPNWHDPGQSMHKWPESNRVKDSYKMHATARVAYFVDQDQ